MDWEYLSLEDVQKHLYELVKIAGFLLRAYLHDSVQNVFKKHVKENAHFSFFLSRNLDAEFFQVLRHGLDLVHT
jgi:hypothetical protein